MVCRFKNLVFFCFHRDHRQERLLYINLFSTILQMPFSFMVCRFKNLVFFCFHRHRTVFRYKKTFELINTHLSVRRFYGLPLIFLYYYNNTTIISIHGADSRSTVFRYKKTFELINTHLSVRRFYGLPLIFLYYYNNTTIISIHGADSRSIQHEYILYGNSL